MTKTQYIQQFQPFSAKSIQNTLSLFEKDNTIAFIARYRKDATENLNEIQIELIQKLALQFDLVQKRKEFILSSIKEQNALEENLEQKIQNSYDLNELEDFYLPFKKKRKTKADLAIENGLLPLAKIIRGQQSTNIEIIAKNYCNQHYKTIEEVLNATSDILCQWIVEDAFFRKVIRGRFQQQAQLSTKVVTAKQNEVDALKYERYFFWNEPLRKVASHRLLALLRAQEEGFIKITIAIDATSIIDFIKERINKHPKQKLHFTLEQAITNAYKKHLAPSIAKEVLEDFKTKADVKSIALFSENLSQLLLTAPLGEKRVLAIDPGFKTGCKIVCLDANGNLLHNETIFPHAPQKETVLASKKIKSLTSSYKIEAIAIGNGTASRETENFIQKIAFDKPLEVFVVSEAGASVYSASKIARNEFPAYDVTVRGAISIGRRLQDPLAELVKIEPKAIGVGQYQHDVNQQLLKDALDQTVTNCVNKIGVNVNTASLYLLSYISGIGEKLAQNIIEYRNANGGFKNRNDLKKVPRLGEKAFHQAAAFVRITNSSEILDSSSVHPEAYAVVYKMANQLGITIKELIGNTEFLNKINPENFTNENFGILYIKDIVKELEKPGLDPRKQTNFLIFDKNLKTIEQVEIGKIYNGIINNITHFGCFVDFGIKENGLIHISNLNSGFVSDVCEIVKLHQHVKVKVLSVDFVKKQIQLSLVV